MKSYRAIIIGSGAAGYAAANRLIDFGVSDIALVAENRTFGTSRNTGSDKQTYYKADLSVSRQGILDMAEAIYNGGAIDGDMAIVESANSIRCFYTLVDLGVRFPEGEYGEFIGYQTDHDTSERATSIGPLTSKAMTEALETAALGKGLNLIDNAIAVKLLVENNVVKGLVIFNKTTSDFETILADNVILAVGGSACVYDKVVYPPSQHGMMSLALDAGCNLSNIEEWQYGIASTKFRWNLSGSYQQVIPRYISIDENGVEREFLSDYMEQDIVCQNIFLKGYEWPFDTRKVAGSSKVDIAVLEEIKKGRRIYMDFMHNPSGLDISKVKVAYDYLNKADSLGDTPIERLEKLNPRAIELYRDHNIDIAKEYLEIAVCAQHCNGGVAIDINYETDVKGLFAIGEVSGNFGVYRPGGTALNSTQVGALRVAKYIRDKAANNCKADESKIERMTEDAIGEYMPNLLGEDNVVETIHKLEQSMTADAGIVRDLDKLTALKDLLKKYLDGTIKVTVSRRERLGELIKCYDMIKTDYVLVNTIISMAHEMGSHGGAMIIENGSMLENKGIAMDNVVMSNYDSVTMRKRRPLVPKTYSFERELNKTK